MNTEEFFEKFGAIFELDDIESIEEDGYEKCSDIMVGGDHSFILSSGLVSHNSALGGLLPILGRDGIGYYTLKGKPLNAYSQPSKKFLENTELTGLFQVITNGLQDEPLPDGKFYELEINGEKMVVNESDEVKINEKWIAVKDLIKN